MEGGKSLNLLELVSCVEVFKKRTWSFKQTVATALQVPKQVDVHAEPQCSTVQPQKDWSSAQ